MNNIKDFLRLLGSVFCGADLFILHMCKEDKEVYIKKELGIFLIASLTIYAVNGIYLWGILVLLLYKMFLSNLNLVSKGNGAYSFLKWLILIALVMVLSPFSFYAARIHCALVLHSLKMGYCSRNHCRIAPYAITPPPIVATVITTSSAISA